MRVSKLAYVGANATDLAAWKSYGTEVLGFETGSDAGSKRIYLRADQRHHRLSVHAADNDDLAYVGWEVKDHAALEALAGSLVKQGTEVKAGTPEELADRRVIEMVYFKCPFIGLRMELTVGNETIFERYTPTRPLSGFLTGELGMGHVALYTTSDLEAMTKFYIKNLGFGLSDWVVSPEGKRLASFLHCNPRHHSMAIIQYPMAKRMVQHVFFETNSLDDVGYTYDLCAERKIAATTIGRHPNDRSVSFYFKTPSRWFIEYGYQLRVVDPASWTAESYVLEPGIGWGHAGLRNLEG